MSESTGPQRLFNEKETGAILKRATELQGRHHHDVLPGLTESELQQIAAEVGIDSIHLKAAIQDISTGSAAKPGFSPLGGPHVVERERVFDGEMDDKTLEATLAEISRTFGVAGQTVRRGATVEWTHAARKQQYQVTLTSKNGKTSVRVFSSFARIALVSFMPLMALSLIAAINLPIGLHLASWLEMVIAFSVMATAYLASFTAFGIYSRQQQKKAQRLMDRVEHIVAPATGIRTGQEDNQHQAELILEADRPEAPVFYPERAARRERS